MFDVGEFVWIEYDDREAFIGSLRSVEDDELELVQTMHFKRMFEMTDKRMEDLYKHVESFADAELKSACRTKGLGGFISSFMGRKQMVDYLVSVKVADDRAEGYSYLEALSPYQRIVLPRHGAVVKDGELTVKTLIGMSSEPDAEPEEDAVDPTESEIKDAVSKFSDEIEDWNRKGF